MSDQATARTGAPADGLQVLRLLALVAVAAGVGLLAAAAFVLSYAGIHAVALYAGVPPRLARIYPLIFDAMLVVACAAVLSLREAGLPSRCYAWLSMLGLIVVAAAADTLHATGTRLPHKPTAAVVAIIPWALVLIGFGLLLCMLRQARLRQAAEEEGLRPPSGQAEVPAGLDALFGPKVPLAANGSSAPPEPSAAPEPAGAEESPAEDTATGAAPRSPEAQESPTQAAAAAPVTAQADPAADPAVDLVIDTEPGQDDPASDEGSAWTRERQPAGAGPRPNGDAASAFSPAPTMAPDEAGTGEPEAKTEPRAKTEPGPRSASGPEAENEPGAWARPEPEGEREAKTGAEPEGGSEAEAGPAPVLAAATQFDRMQSSPVQPDA
jgi:hypothetical protein